MILSGYISLFLRRKINPMLKKITQSIIAASMIAGTCFHAFDAEAQRAVNYTPDVAVFESWAGTLPTGYSVAPSSLVYRGTSPSTTGGLYSIAGEGFGWQASSSVTSLTLTGDYENTTGDEITALEISYDAFTIIERDSRIPAWTVSVDGVEVPELTWTYGDGDQTLSATVSGLSIADGAVFTISLSSSRGDGGGSTPMIGLENVSVVAQSATVPSIMMDPDNDYNMCQGTNSLSFIPENFPPSTLFQMNMSTELLGSYSWIGSVSDGTVITIPWSPGTYYVYVTSTLGGVAYYSDTVMVTVSQFGVSESNFTTIAHDSLYPGYFMGFEENTCNLVAVAYSDDDLGEITISQTVGAPFMYMGRPLVGRYFDIHSSTGTATTPYTVDLHFSISDIDDYNALPQVVDGTFDSIAYDLSNIRVAVFHGNPSDGTTGPNGMYDATAMEELEAYPMWFNPDISFLVTTSTSGFSGFFIYAEGETPLNMSVSALAGQHSQGINHLSWNTYDATEGLIFEVQHSNDGREFTTIGRLASQNKAAEYSFQHTTPKGMDFYRLAIIDARGKVSYSNIVTIESDEQDALWAVYPNPTTNSFYIQINDLSTSASGLQVVDNLGRVIHQQSISATGTYTIDCSQWSSGAYHIIWTEGTQQHRKQVVKY